MCARRLPRRWARPLEERRWLTSWVGAPTLGDMVRQRVFPCARWAALAAVGLFFALAAGGQTDVLPNLTGRWAVRQVTSEIGTVPLLGERQRTSASLTLVDISQDGRSIRGVESACSTTVDNGTSLVSTAIPAAFVASLPKTTWEAELEETTEGWRFERPWVTSVKGVHLENPESDPLPTSADDPRVFDQDGDGKPGLTVHVEVMGLIGGDIYVVQRDRTRLSGVVTSDAAVDGLVEWTSEQSVLGATNAFLLGGAEARPDPDPTHSYFQARRVDGHVTCADLADVAWVLFGD